MNLLPFTLVDLGPADSSAGFGAGAAARAQTGDNVAAGEGADLLTFPELGDFDVRYVHGYGKVANVAAGSNGFFGGSFWDPPLEDFRGIFVRPLGAKTGPGREAGGDAMALVCPFWVNTRRGKRRTCSLFPSCTCGHTARIRGPTQDELGQLQKVRGVPLSEIGGVLPGTREVGGADQTAALTARVEAFWLRWEKEARSDMLRKVAASESFAGGKSSVVPGKRARSTPPRCPGRCRLRLHAGFAEDWRVFLALLSAKPCYQEMCPPAGQTSELLRLRSEDELLKGKVALLEYQVAERDAQLVAVCGARQRADELLKERDSQLLAERSTATKAESAWRTREKKLLDELEVARGQRGTKRTAPEPVAMQESAAEDKAWLTQCAVESRTGLQQGVSATALLEDNLKRVDKAAAPPPSSAHTLHKLLKDYPVGDILQPPRKKGATKPGTPTAGRVRSQGYGAR